MIPVVAGIALIVVMTLGSSSLKSDGTTFYGDGGANVVIEELTSSRGETGITVLGDDSALDEAGTLTFDHELKLTLESDE